MSLPEVRAAMARAIDVDLDANVYAYPPANPALPCVVVGWPQQWDLVTVQVTGMKPDYLIPVEVLVGFNHPESADGTLMALIESVVDAVQYDPTLDDNCDSLSCQQVTNIGVVDVDGDRKALAATILVQVYG